MFLRVINGPALCRVITDKTGYKLLSTDPRRNLFLPRELSLLLQPVFCGSGASPPQPLELLPF